MLYANSSYPLAPFNLQQIGYDILETTFIYSSYNLNLMANRLNLTVDNSVSAIAVVYLAERLIQHGVISREWLRDKQPDTYLVLEESKTSTLTTLYESRLPEQSMIELWQNFKKNSDDSTAFDIGCDVDVNHAGIVTNWISQSVNLEQAFDKLMNYINLINPSESWAMRQEGELNEYIFYYKRDDYPSVAIERSMVTVLAWARHLVAESLQVKYCRFQFDQPSYIDKYQAFFCKDILFNQPENIIAIDRKQMSTPILSHSPIIERLIQDRVDAMMRRMSDDLFLNKIDKLLSEDLSKYKYASSVYERLHMSRATFFRKLKSRELTFHQLLDNARQTQYLKFKRDALHIQDITKLLGYSNQSSLYKAIKKWTN